MRPLALALICALLAASPVQVYAADAAETDIRAFIEEVAERTGLTFFVDPEVRGTVAVDTSRAQSNADLLALFASTLEENGVATLPSVGGAYRILPVAEAERRRSQAPGPTPAAETAISL